MRNMRNKLAKARRSDEWPMENLLLTELNNYTTTEWPDPVARCVRCTSIRLQYAYNNENKYTYK